MNTPRRLLLASIALFLGWGGTHLKAAESSGTIELLNGRDLSGWRHMLADPKVPRENVWSMKDGILICTGAPIGVLYTEKNYTDFRFVVEYRWAPGAKPGNSGIMSRMTPGEGGLPKTIEVQLHHGNAGDLLGLHGVPIAEGQPRWFGRDSKVAGRVTGVKKIKDAENKPGEWNRVEIVAKGGSYTVRINDQLVNEATGVHIKAGPIGLQSEGGEVHFRRASLTPLTAK